jgi:signal transduction histidine kinase
MEKQLLHAHKMESLGVLAGGIAHDFNNILTSVLGNTELALMRLDSGSPVTEHLRRIERSSLRAADLAKQMLAYSGKGRFVLDSLDINHLVEETVNSLEGSLSGSTVRLNLTRPLKPVLADANQIRQVIVNLAINAAEAYGDTLGEINITTDQAMYDSGFFQDLWISSNLPVLYDKIHRTWIGNGCCSRNCSRPQWDD